jgi:hypothetical protein
LILVERTRSGLSGSECDRRSAANRRNTHSALLREAIALMMVLIGA